METLPINYSGIQVETKCPKCKKQNFTTHEVFEKTFNITVENGIMNDRVEDAQLGGLIRFRCHCNSCDHWWKPRGAKKLTHILPDY